MRAVFATPPWTQWTHLCGTTTDPASDPAGEPAADAEALGEVSTTDPDRRDGQAAQALDVATRLAGQTPLLRGVRKGGTLSPAPLSGDGLHQMVKRRAASAGITGPVGFHSLRAGFVTQARRAGADTRAVRRQTRHGSDAMVEIYDRDHAPLIGNAVLQLGL